MEDCVLGSVCQVFSPGIVAGNDQIPHSLLPQSCYQVLWNSTQSKPCTQHTTISVLLEGSVLSYLRLGVSNHCPRPQLCSPHSHRTWHHVMRTRRTLAARTTTQYYYILRLHKGGRGRKHTWGPISLYVPHLALASQARERGKPPPTPRQRSQRPRHCS